MPTETLPTRAEAASKESLSRGFWLAIALHAGGIAGLLVAAWIGHSGRNWGSGIRWPGPFRPALVSSIPLPPKQRFVENQVLASEHSSAAATPTPPAPKAATASKPKAEPAPKPNEVLIPTKTQPKPATKADNTHPNPATHPPVPAPPTPKATTGDTSGMQLPQSMVQMKNGTALLTVEDRTFGDRYAFYIQVISRKIAQSKAAGDPDGPEPRQESRHPLHHRPRRNPHRRYRVSLRSGSSALDISTLRASSASTPSARCPRATTKSLRFEYDSNSFPYPSRLTLILTCTFQPGAASVYHRRGDAFDAECAPVFEACGREPCRCHARRLSSRRPCSRKTTSPSN